MISNTPILAGESISSNKDLVERAKEVKVAYCQSLDGEGFEIGTHDGQGCGFYQRMPCQNQGRLLYELPLAQVYECRKERKPLKSL